MINDKTKAEIIRLSKLLYNEQYGPSRQDYKMHADLTTGATNVNTLTSSRRGLLWVDILKEAGVPPAKFTQSHAALHKELNAKGRYPFYWERNLETKAP